ncbi:MAG: hypothetical protein M1538_00480, partial [Candidatus Marsarchaeota archaeon]|nr:hypothetical protein [Candidatus Marsarchaeota archaeon]
ARKAIRYIRERIAHYTKIDVENVKIGYDVNNMVFKHYAKYMTPIKLKVNIGTDTADVLMYKEASEESSKNESKDKKKEKKDKVANTKQQEKTKSENIAKENNTNKKEDKKKA